MSTIETLRRCPLFEGFSDDSLEIFVKVMAEKLVPAESEIFAEAETGSSLYVVKAGQLKVETSDAGGAPVFLDLLKPGDSFGEMSFVISAPHLSTVTTVEESVILELRRADFMQLQKDKPQTCLKLLFLIIQIFAKRVHGAQGLLKTLVRSTAS